MKTGRIFLPVNLVANAPAAFGLMALAIYGFAEVGSVGPVPSATAWRIVMNVLEQELARV